MWASSSRRPANVRRTFAFYCSSPKNRNTPNPSPTENRFGLFFFGAGVLIGLFEKPCHTNAFLNFRASNFLVFSLHNTRLKWHHSTSKQLSNSDYAQFETIRQHLFSLRLAEQLLLRLRLLGLRCVILGKTKIAVLYKP